MTTSVPRSLLFVPGDSERKITRAFESRADAVILDLEDSVAPGAKADARAICAAFMHARDGKQLLVRINALDAEECLDDLAAIVRHRPDAIVLPKCADAADLRRLDLYLAALERRDGLDAGSIGVVAIVTETARSLAALSTYAETLPSRTRAMTWGGEDLAADIGASLNRDASGRYFPLFQHARTFCLLASASARVAAIDAVFTDFRDMAGLLAEAEEAAAAGFSGKLAIHPAQVDPINQAFTPSSAQTEWATRVVAAFDTADDGVAALDGKMLDRPHLTQAWRILVRAAPHF